MGAGRAALASEREGALAGPGPASLSGAFFAAPECGNAAAGGAAEIATRHPPSHNASRDALLCFTIRDAMCLTYVRTL